MGGFDCLDVVRALTAHANNTTLVTLQTLDQDQLVNRRHSCVDMTFRNHCIVRFLVCVLESFNQFECSASQGNFGAVLVHPR